MLVSGAGSGIGRAIAVEVADQGAGVVLCGRSEQKLAETQTLLPGHARSAMLALDLTQHSQIIPKVTELVARIGRLYGLCHCAGVVQTLPLAASTPERVNAMMSLNFGAGLELCRALARRDVLHEQGGSVL